ncbi:MAG: hypothetical protein IKK93_05595 [Campylobacter sp.]|nr:hypothetical protein [Campylobacter sp.]MBR6611704.1 hypothetical protein [Campylobacter sp.]
MPGISGYAKSKKNNSNISFLVHQITSDVKLVYEYSDSYVQMSNFGLNLHKENRIDDENNILIIEGCCYNIDELQNIFNINISNFAEFISWAYSNNKLKNFETNIVIINIHKRLTSKAINCINADSTNLHYLLKERL